MFVAIVGQIASRGLVALTYPDSELAFELHPHGTEVLNARTGQFLTTPYAPDDRIAVLKVEFCSTMEEAFQAAHQGYKNAERDIDARFEGFRPVPPARGTSGGSGVEL